MNKELLKRWVAALRSGEYTQGARKLRMFDPVAECTRYCCLGVLREIEPSIREVNGEFLDRDSLQQHMGGDIQQKDLAVKNDFKMPFPEIADYIEKKYLNNEENK